MSTFLVLSDIRITTGKYNTGDLIEDTQVSTASIEAAGGSLVAFTEPMRPFVDRFTKLRRVDPTTESSVLLSMLSVAGVISAGGESNTSSKQGSGEGVALTKSGVDLPLKTIEDGAYFTFSLSANALEISSCA